MIGYLPRRALELVLEWLELHQLELMDNWRRASNGEQMLAIAPLE